VVVGTETHELLSCELCAIVCNDGVRDPEAMNDIREECYRLLRFDASERSDLDALGNFVDGDQQVHEVPRRLFQRTDEV
jgi:hypothetical protein